MPTIPERLEAATSSLETSVGTLSTAITTASTAASTASAASADAEAAAATAAAAAAGIALTPTVVKTAAYTAAVGDLIPVDTTGGNVTITLPAAPVDKVRIGIKHVIRGSTNTVTVARGGSTDVFNKTGGSTSITLTLLNQSVILQYNASSHIWYVTSDDLALSQLDARYPVLGSDGLIPPSLLPAWNGENFVMVTTVAGSGAALTNGAALLAAYAYAKSIATPNGVARSQFNTVTVLVPPALYDLNGAEMVLDANFVNVVGLCGGANQCPLIKTARATDGQGAFRFALGSVDTPFVTLQNLVLQNTSSVTANASSSTDHASVLRFTDGDLNSIAFKNVTFLGVNLINPIGSGMLGAVFERCVITAAFLYLGGFQNCTFIDCGTDIAGKEIVFIGDASVGAIFGGNYFSAGMTIDLTDFDIAGQSFLNITVNLKATVASSLILEAGNIFKDCMVTFLKTGSGSHDVQGGEFYECFVTWTSQTMRLGSAMFKNCKIKPATSTTTIAGSTFPKFYGCRFAAVMAVVSGSAAVDFQHCNLPSNWGTPANLTYSQTLAAGFNVIASSSNFNSP